LDVTGRLAWLVAELFVPVVTVEVPKVVGLVVVDLAVLSTGKTVEGPAAWVLGGGGGRW
jgi:hypothetical protein